VLISTQNKLLNGQADTTKKESLFLFFIRSFILTGTGEMGIYIPGCVLWPLHNYRLFIPDSEEGGIEGYKGGIAR